MGGEPGRRCDLPAAWRKEEGRGVMAAAFI
jgi:hypothetical protein